MENCKFCSRETADCDCLQAPGGNGPSLLQDVWARSLPKLWQAPDWKQCAGTSRDIPAFPSPFHRLPGGKERNDTGVTNNITARGLVSRDNHPHPPCAAVWWESQPSSGRFRAVAINSIHFLCKEGTLLESKHRVWSSKTCPEPDYKKRNASQGCFWLASAAPPCSCLRSWVSHMLVISVLVPRAGELQVHGLGSFGMKQNQKTYSIC